jgi:hypothetical protein
MEHLQTTRVGEVCCISMDRESERGVCSVCRVDGGGEIPKGTIVGWPDKGNAVEKDFGGGWGWRAVGNEGEAEAALLRGIECISAFIGTQVAEEESREIRIATHNLHCPFAHARFEAHYVDVACCRESMRFRRSYCPPISVQVRMFSGSLTMLSLTPESLYALQVAGDSLASPRNRSCDGHHCSLRTCVRSKPGTVLRR